MSKEKNKGKKMNNKSDGSLGFVPSSLFHQEQKAKNTSPLEQKPIPPSVISDENNFAKDSLNSTRDEKPIHQLFDSDTFLEGDHVMTKKQLNLVYEEMSVLRLTLVKKDTDILLLEKNAQKLLEKNYQDDKSYQQTTQALKEDNAKRVAQLSRANEKFGDEKEAIAQQNDELMARVEQLETAYEKLKQSKNDEKKEFHKYAKDNDDDFDKQLKTRDRELKSLTGKVQKLNEQVKQKDIQVTEANKAKEEMDAQNSNLAGANKENKELSAKCRLRLATSEENFKKLEEEASQKQVDITNLKEKLEEEASQKQVDITNLKEKLQQRDVNDTAMKLEVKDLKLKVSQHIDELARLKREGPLIERESEQNEERATENLDQSERQQLNVLKKTSVHQIKKLNNSNQQLTNKLQEKEAKIEKLKHQLKDLRVEFEKHKDQGLVVESMDKQLIDYAEDIARLNNQLKDKRMTVRRQTEIIHRLETSDNIKRTFPDPKTSDAIVPDPPNPTISKEDQLKGAKEIKNIEKNENEDFSIFMGIMKYRAQKKGVTIGLLTEQEQRQVTQTVLKNKGWYDLFFLDHQGEDLSTKLLAKLYQGEFQPDRAKIDYWRQKLLEIKPKSSVKETKLSKNEVLKFFIKAGSWACVELEISNGKENQVHFIHHQVTPTTTT